MTPITPTGKDGPGARALLRTILPPILAVLFITIGVSGTLMLCDLAPDWLEEVHERVGLGFVAVATVHAAFNGRVLVGHLRSRPAIVALVVSLVGCAAAAMTTGDGNDEEEERREAAHEGGDDKHSKHPRKGKGEHRTHDD